LARKLDLCSPFGAFLDPVADKMMVSTALIYLVMQLPTWWFATPVAIIICREIGISALREWMAERQKRNSVQVGWLGKVKTAMQMISTAILLYSCPGISEFDINVSLGLTKTALFTTGLIGLYISAAITVLSGVQYLQAAWPDLNDTR
jgi:CDP-diacylglycerol---glycerol-3-phosphate 3-phosphatidyltransferase